MNDLFDQVEKARCDICHEVDEIAGRTLNIKPICPGCMAMMYAGSIHNKSNISPKKMASR